MRDYTSPNWANAALLTIDVQQSFTLPGSPAAILGTLEVVPKIQQLARVFRQSNKPIIHVIRIYLSDGSNVDLCRTVLGRSQFYLRSEIFFTNRQDAKDAKKRRKGL